MMLEGRGNTDSRAIFKQQFIAKFTISNSVDHSSKVNEISIVPRQFDFTSFVKSPSECKLVLGFSGLAPNTEVFVVLHVSNYKWTHNRTAVATLYPDGGN